MYVPDLFRMDDREAAFALMRRFDFALVVTAEGGIPLASHLPILLDAERGPNGTLMGHMARANPQWRGFTALAETGGEAMVVFSGPHGYISPRWYGHDGKAVPTWNYLAVHAYGPPEVLDEDPESHLETLVATQERGFPEPWSLASQDRDYLSHMRRGIVAFEIPISRLEAKAKLSQNKTPEERAGVIAALDRSGESLARTLAAEMRAREPG